MTLIIEEQPKETTNIQTESIDIPPGFKMTELG